MTRYLDRYALTYIDMYPELVNPGEPSTLVIVAGAGVALIGVYLITVFLFSL